MNDINVLEFWPVLCVVVRWGHLWRNQKVVLYADNKQVLNAINSNKSRSWVVMGWLREVFLFVHNLLLVAKHITSKKIYSLIV